MQGMRRLSPRLKLRSVDFCCSFLDGSEVFCLYFGCFATNVVFVGTLVTTASVSESSDNTVPFVCGVLEMLFGLQAPGRFIAGDGSWFWPGKGLWRLRTIRRD